MSLVGSLGDLGLGDILQIISLSRKSGVLLLRCGDGEGQIIFDQGLIRAAFNKGGPSALRDLLAKSPEVSDASLGQAFEDARSRGVPLARVLIERGELSSERLDELLRDHIEAAVLEMFAWPTGEFSFEVREVEVDASEGLSVCPGMNPQFLALEGTRRADEHQIREGVAQGELLEERELQLGPAPEAEPEPTHREEPAATSHEDVSSAAEAPEPKPRRVPPVIAIDPQLPVLEWLKGALKQSHPRIHVFQRTDQGIARIRQYLARAEVPLVLIAADAPPDPISGARDPWEITERLKRQSSRMSIGLIVDAEDQRQSAPARRKRVQPDLLVCRPSPTHLADPRCIAQREERAAALRQALAEHDCQETTGSGPGGKAAELGAAEVARLREVSERIRDPGSRGEVLSLAMDFAAATFSRVAILMVHEEEVVGLAQLGLAKAGGPEDRGLRGIRMPCKGAAGLSEVLASRSSLRRGPADEGDRRFSLLLGNAVPRECYLAPIESGGQVVAILYADNLPAAAPLGDTSALEVVLHEAGLALDRAVLEHALAEVEGHA